MWPLICAWAIVATASVSTPSLTPNVDAPRWVWWSPQWNLGEYSKSGVVAAFGPATTWSTGDAGCSDHVWAYEKKDGERRYFVVFHRGEVGDGIRMTTLKDYVAWGRTAQAILIRQGRIPDHSGLHCDEDGPVKKPPFRKLGKPFYLDVKLGQPMKVYREQLGRPRYEASEREIDFQEYHWWSTSVDKDGKEWTTFCRAVFGYKNRVLEYYDVWRVITN